MAISSHISGLTDDEFEFFKNIVYSETGIKLSEHKRSLLQSRIMKRLRLLKLPDFQSYRNYFTDNYQIEIHNFINVITTNKTEFMRERRHFDFMLQTALPEFDKTAESELRIWSAGCSTGEEPYSIGITCSEYYAHRKKPDLKILATDIDTQVLSTGYKGIYKKEHVEIFDKPVIDSYFKYSDNFYTIKDSLKEMIRFRRLNLLDQKYPMKKKFFIIFCRNVIIYFDKETQHRLFMKMYDYLDDRGFLFIGHSENLTNISDKFKSIGHTMYVKNL